MATIYKNGGIPDEFKFVDISSDVYIDFYSSSNVTTGNSYTIYRVSKDNEDLYCQKNIIADNNVSLVEVETSSSYLYKMNFPDILMCFFIYFLMLLFFINLITSLVKRNGLLSSLF